MTEHSPTASIDLAAEARAARRFAMWLIIVVAAAMSFAQIVKSTPLQSANDRSRWSTVWSLVERGTYQIDEIDAAAGWTTIDKVRHEGHFYSTKPPLQSTLIAGVYWCVKRVTGWNLSDHTAEVSRVILLLVNWLPQVISLIVLAMLVERYARHDFGKLFVLVVASWGTLLGPFSSSLNNHSPAAIGVLLAMYPLLRILIDGDHRKRFFVLSGFFSAATFTLELPAALLVVVFGGLLFHANPRRTLALFVPAALIPVIAFVALNNVVTGTLMPFYSSYDSDKYRYEHEGIPSYWSNPQELDRNLDSPLMYFVHCTIGHHGLLSLTPVWLLTGLGWFGWRRWPTCCLRKMLLCGAGVTAVVFGFYLTRTQNYNYGGNSVALRWMLWLVPLWLVAMIPVFDEWGSRRGFQILSSFLLALSVVFASLPGSNPWQSTWLLSLMEKWGWVNYSEPPPAFEFGHSLWSWFPKLGEPKNADSMGHASSSVKFCGTGSSLFGFSPQTPVDGEIELTLMTTRVPNRRTQRVAFRWSQIESKSESLSVYVDIDVAAFEAGKKSSQFLKSSEGGELSREALVSAQRLVTGLPQSVEYRPGQIRYLKTPLRPKSAFRCQRAATQTLFHPKHFDHPMRYRVDLWLCDEIPFGVAQIEITISDPASGQMQSFQRLTAVEATGFSTQTDTRPTQTTE